MTYYNDHYIWIGDAFVSIHLEGDNPEDVNFRLLALASKLEAVNDLYEALKDLRHHFKVAGELLGLTDSHIQNILSSSDKALSKAE